MSGGDVGGGVTKALAEAADQAALVEAALARLVDPRFGREELAGRSRRSVYVEAVLTAGYPWALQLEPADVTRARELAQASRGGRPVVLLAAVLGFLLGLLGGLGAAFMTKQAPPPVSAPARPPGAVGSSAGEAAPRAGSFVAA